MTHIPTPEADQCFVCQEPWREHEPAVLWDHTASWLADPDVDAFEQLRFIGGVIAQGVLTAVQHGEYQTQTYLDFYLQCIGEALNRRDKIRQLRST